jgi:hypothetical protein
MCERARRTWTKKQRAEKLTEEQCQSEPGKGALESKATKRFSAA